MNNSRPERQYIAEVVWLPTYIAVGALVLGRINDSTVATAAMLVALVACRVVLELVYRVVFGNARLQLRTGVIALGCQMVVWGLAWFWYAQVGSLRA